VGFFCRPGRIEIELGTLKAESGNGRVCLMQEEASLMREVTAAIIRDGDRVLLTRRAAGEHLAGQWEFPGGKVHEGETPEACLARELVEELSLVCAIGEKVAESDYHYDHGAFRIIAYEAEIQSGELALSVHDQAEWVAVDALLEYDLAPADIPIAEEIRAG